MRTGRLIAWNAKEERGLILDLLTEKILRFKFGHREDRQAFVEGLQVTYELVRGLTPVNVEAASGAFLRHHNRIQRMR